MKRTEKQLEKIAAKANKVIQKKYPLLRNEVKVYILPYIFEADEKVVKS